MKYKVPFIKPDFPQLDDISADYSEIVASNWFTNFGPFERRFSQAIAKYIGEGFYVATFSNATSALIASILTVLGRGNNSKYIAMPSFTFAAVADAVLLCGYLPIFIDIEYGTLNMDISEVEKLFIDEEYQQKVSAILFCNAFGVGAANIADWEALSKKLEVPLIIDSAAGFGSLYSKDRKVGSAGVCEIFSFHATKPFAIGEGGAAVSKDEKLIESMKSVQNFGFDKSRNASQLGFNGKLQEINAAIGLRQFEKFESALASRREAYEIYRSDLNPTKFEFQDNAGEASLCFATVVVRRKEDRDKYLVKLKDSGIDAKAYYSPSLHKQEYFKNIQSFSSLEKTDTIDDSVISLPIHDNMKLADVSLVTKVLNS